MIFLGFNDKQKETSDQYNVDLPLRNSQSIYE